ncbi:response regulator transcription factor [Gemmatimonas sp.]|uniref:response regulator transcription factor n=1 Tax=Gemmatimonas sp. TaxID=1962908 RepID=UPI003DA6B97C
MNLLLVEDDRDLAESLSALLRQSHYNVLAVRSIKEARAVVNSFDPGIVVLDRQLPDGDGVSLIPALGARPTLVLTAMSDTQDMVYGFDQGADDYLTKPFIPAELLARLRALRRRRGLYAVPERRFANVRLGERPFVEVDGTPLVLRPREFDVFAALIERYPKVARREWILTRLYDESDLAANRISVHVSRLRKALTDVGAAIDIKSIHGQGYRLEQTASS